MLPLDKLTIFLDENHCNNKRILAVLAKEGVNVERHLDYFARGTPDADWLPVIGQNGWALLTTDKRIRYRTNEREAVIKHSVRMFYFSKNDLSGQQMASALETALPQIRNICIQHQPPFFAAITKTGEVYLKKKFTELL